MEEDQGIVQLVLGPSVVARSNVACFYCQNEIHPHYKLKF